MYVCTNTILRKAKIIIASIDFYSRTSNVNSTVASQVIVVKSYVYYKYYDYYT